MLNPGSHCRERRGEVPIEKTGTIYQCSHSAYGCMYVNVDKDNCIGHEDQCWFNPKNRSCPTCKNFKNEICNIDKSKTQLLIWECEYWKIK